MKDYEINQSIPASVLDPLDTFMTWGSLGISYVKPVHDSQFVSPFQDG